MKKSEKYLLFFVSSLISFLVISYTYTKIIANINLKILKDTCDINSFRMDISSEKGYKQIIISDASQLKKIDSALQNLIIIHKIAGQVYDVWSHIYIRKCNRDIEFWVHYSKQYGWTIDINGNYYSSPYIIGFIQSYVS